MSGRFERRNGFRKRTRDEDERRRSHVRFGVPAVPRAGLGESASPARRLRRRSAPPRDSLRRNGFVVLDPPVDARRRRGRGWCAARPCVPREASTDLYLRRLTDRARCLGIDPETDIFRFSEICARARGGRRFDVTAQISEADGGRLRDPRAASEGSGGGARLSAARGDVVARDPRGDRAVDLARVGALGAHGSDTKRSGAGTARSETRAPASRRRPGAWLLPRAPAQHFHADRPRAGSPTRSFPWWTFQKIWARRGSEGEPRVGPRRPVPRPARRGGAPRRRRRWRRRSRGERVLLYDYRVMHAGGAARARRPRPLAYVMRASAGLEDLELPGEVHLGRGGAIEGDGV